MVLRATRSQVVELLEQARGEPIALVTVANAAMHEKYKTRGVYSMSEIAKSSAPPHN